MRYNVFNPLANENAELYDDNGTVMYQAEGQDAREATAQEVEAYERLVYNAGQEIATAEAATANEEIKAEALAILMAPTTGTTIAALRATVEQQRIAYLTLLGEEPV